MSKSHPNTFPKLHNAAWPGVVGKGSPGAEPPIDLDTMLDLTAAAEVDGDQVRRRRPVPLRPARQHRRRPTTTSRRWPTRSPGKGFVIGSVVAPVWPPTGGGSAMDEGEGRKKFLDAGPQGRAGSPRSSASWASGPTASSGSTRPAAPADWAKDPEGNQKKIAETFKQAGDDRPRPRRAARGRGRDLLGRHALLADDGRPARTGRRARDRRLPGRHGPHAALHARRERPRGPHPPARISTGRTRRRSTRRCRTLDRRPAALDDRLPRRPERRDRLRLGLARPHRPPLPGDRPQRQARHPAPRRLLAPRRERAS